MDDLLLQSFRIANLPFTVLVMVAAGYWLTVILGVFHVDSLDFHVDLDMDGALASLLSFLRVRAIPVSVWFSVFAISGWALAVNVNYLMSTLLPIPEVLRLLIGLPIYGAAAAGVCTVVARMVEPLFRVKEPKTSKSIVGQSCTVTSVEVSATFGTAEVKTGGAPLLINVRAHSSEQLKAGDSARIYEHDTKENVFQITKAG